MALLFGVVCWGVTPVILRALTPYIDGWTANGIRYPIAAVLYWPLLIISFRAGRLNLKLVRRCLVPAMCSLAGQVFWALAFYELPASEIGFLIRLSSVWAVVGSMLLFHDERKLLSKPGFYFGVALIVGGFLAMSWFRSPTNTEVISDATQSSTEGSYSLGLLYILLCGGFFGMYLVSVRKCIPDISPLLSFGVVANIVSIGTIAGMLWKGDVSSIADQTTFSWFLLVSSTLLGIAMGHILLFVAVQRLGAAITSICQTLMPFVTAGVASVTLGEALNGWQWISGCVMVFGAIALLSIKHDIKRDTA